MKLSVATVASLVLAFVAGTAGAVTFEVTNNASTTPGGQRFDVEYGADYARQVLSEAASFIWNVFNQTGAREADRRPVDGGGAVTLVVVDDTDGGIASTSGSAIELSEGYVARFTGDLKAELTGVLYHEATHVWQWGLQDYAAHWWVFEGVADFVRLKAGYAPAHWVAPGQGRSWDGGYDVTARFLDYCDSVIKPGFVGELNGKMKDSGYSDGYFVEILGKSVQDLWNDYKAKYGG
ncbi:hypothetical protein CFC21_001745 [Triticum aestivum]|uniref:Secretory protein n=3 Tax=Triticum TaxID=4564 RepID=A0A3B5XYG4_WHEAT|nr:uncharacterized protein LOC119285110 [Triticum dicoccoides]XP_044396879.1 uncharacterized protein LOC123120964 [Triticum aestivum]KAF6983582.1 hypothetical protein CFC21_001744 [Triticum aestivum]KAF6983583.1 hypothetical protein CFC21_001745 [Triticum aestivum]